MKMNHAVTRKALALLAITLLCGCSCFNRDWHKAAAQPTPANSIEGRWEGSWTSASNAHTGNLRCLLSHKEGASYEARFRATYGKVFHFSYATPLTVHELLRWPGVIEEAELAQDSLPADAALAMKEALDAFAESREREGAALGLTLISRIDVMESIVQRITPLIPQVIAQFQQRSIERLEDALGLSLQKGAGANAALSHDEVIERVRLEVTLYGIRIDVAEELSRLSAHLTETRAILDKGGQVGKRLDFMMQELNREANTVGSKAALKELADASMELKLLIDQMREQVQKSGMTNRRDYLSGHRQFNAGFLQQT